MPLCVTEQVRPAPHADSPSLKSFFCLLQMCLVILFLTKWQIQEEACGELTAAST